MKTPWSTIGYLTFKRTYARRLKEDDVNSPTEEWEDTVNRVLLAANTQLNCGFSHEEVDELRYYMLSLKGTVAGRFLWQLGTSTVNRLGLPSLQNCAACVVDSPIRPFTWAMDRLMLGCGVGFNIQKEYVYKLPKVKENFIIPHRHDNSDADFIVPDTREGWVALLERTLRSAFFDDAKAGFTYSTQLIRGKGAAIKGFGGIASGPEDLCWGIQEISNVIFNRRDNQLRPIDCLDIMNIIGAIVVSGNVRRSAQIAIGDSDDIQYLKAKNWNEGNIPNWRANSNNSVVCNNIKNLPEEFWKTYEGGSEPYGLINIKLSRSCGRIGDTKYKDKEIIAYNPCAEQGLANYETCVTGDTRIQTKDGIFKIQDVVGKQVEVFNGVSWSKTTPFLAKQEDNFTRIHFSDGSYLDVNSDHEFEISRGRSKTSRKLKTDDLMVGDQLPKFELPTDGGIQYDKAYLLGVFCGDGYVDDSVDPELAIELRNKDKGLPDFIMSFNKKSALAFIAGLIDTDGNVSNTGDYRIFGISEKKLRDLQLLCRRASINFAQLSVMCKKGQETNLGTRDHDLYRLTIPSFECGEIPTVLKKAKIVGSRFKINNAHPKTFIDSAPRQRITKIEKLSETKPSYCFSEPIRNMGVFGNVLTYQCCLAEIFLPNINSLDEFKRVATLLYRINKHSLSLHDSAAPETQYIVNKNMRMGIGVTGVLQATDEQRNWLPTVYQYLREYDEEYSNKHNFPTSIKLTTCKPSGTLSLLPGVTPGIHPGYAQYMIRRIRMASNHSLVNVCRSYGYNIEYVKKFDSTEDYSTVVIEFPFAYPLGTKLAKDMTAIDQLEEVRKLQTNWSDNSVSCTVYYRKEELSAIKEYLNKYWDKNFKSLSFLLHSEHGFLQAPYEEIDEEQYKMLVNNTKLITAIDNADIGLDTLDCETGACPIR